MLPGSSSARKSPAGLLHTDARGACTSQRRQLVEKELPPIPSPQAGADIAGHEPSACLHDVPVTISIQHATDTPPQPTLCLGLYHNPLKISESSQLNSVAFTSFPNTSTGNVLRKTKSTHSLRPHPAPPNPEQQRVRGVSMTQTAKRANGHAPSTPLIRKPSFWSRNFSASSSQRLTVPAESLSLQALKSTSPLRVDFTAPPNALSRSRSISSIVGHAGHHSERTAPRPSTTRISIPTLPHNSVAADRTNVRPSTADAGISARRSPMRRPATADSASPLCSRSPFAPSQQFASPPSRKESFPPTPRFKIGLPRPRSSTNPPLLHRISVNLFASSQSSTPKNSSLFSNGVTSSPPSRSPRPSLSQIPPDVLRPRVGESPKAFLNRLVSLVSKGEIAVVLASTGESIYADSLKLFIERFRFHGEPLDVALRRLLMDVGLPRETQQIDRVIEAFADRYLSCNPDLFTSRDHPYILAFSLIMLHTDVFNKSNKRKMSKADYMKNTMLPGLVPGALDCFYDNTVFAPFIFIEDPLDPEGSVEGNLSKLSTASGLSSPMLQSGNALLSRPKVDPYYLIKNNLLDQLRVNVEDQISPENPFRWDGTGISWNYDEILLAFAKGHVVQMVSTDMRSTAPFFALSIGGVGSPSLNGFGGAPETQHTSETWTLKLTKVAVLNRKDELLEGGKRPLNRKWRPYSVALTRSQLLLFRDLSWSSTLPSWSNPPKKPPIPSTSFKPDEVISLNDALAVLDRCYTKHSNTFLLATRDGRHILFQAAEEKEMNEWISRINYASTFKSTGIRMRSLGMTSKIVELTGVAAAASHLHDLQHPNLGQPRVPTWDPGNATSHDGCLANKYNSNGLKDLSSPEIGRTSQLKETFDTVKSELVAARVAAGDPLDADVSPTGPDPPHFTSRSQMVHTRVEDLENRICAANGQIDSSMHVARSIAILTPFRKSTRDRLQDTIQTMSKQIQAMRLDVTKFICHRNILLNDLAVEERNFKHATSLALQAATESLQQHYCDHTTRSSFSTQELPAENVSHEEISTASQSFDSSTYEAFRSALDFGPDWPSSGDAFAIPSFWGLSLASDPLVTPGRDNSPSGQPSLDETSHLSLSATNRSLAEALLHRNLSVAPDVPEEQAEEWNKTKAAKRVSLVKLPSDLRMSAISGKCPRHPEDNDLLTEGPIAVGSITYQTRQQPSTSLCIVGEDAKMSGSDVVPFQTLFDE